jgi:hypothetical protein
LKSRTLGIETASGGKAASVVVNGVIADHSRSPKHPEDSEQVDHCPNYHCLYYKVHE